MNLASIVLAGFDYEETHTSYAIFSIYLNLTMKKKV